MNALAAQIAAFPTTTAWPEKYRIMAAVLDAFVDEVFRFVRELAPNLTPQRAEEGAQAGCIGLLLALEYVPPEARTSAAAFWLWARRNVRDEIKTWLGAT